MKHAALIAQLLSLIGTALIILGVLFWTGRALLLVPLHMLLGALLVVCLWVLVALALLARAGIGLALFVLVWSLIVPALGVAQLRLLPGSLHWLIQSIHLAVGFAAVGLGQALARRIPRGSAMERAAPESA